MSADSRVLRATDPGNYPGKPLGTASPDHQPCVPTAAGVPPYCTCGYVGGNGTNRPLLADHLRQVDPTYGALAAVSS